MQSVARAAAAEQAAVSQTTSIGSSTVIRKPATPGPARNATPNMVWKPPATLSTCTPEVVDTSASSACRAVMPGTSKIAPATPRATNHDSESPNVASTTAIAATDEGAADVRGDRDVAVAEPVGQPAGEERRGHGRDAGRGRDHGRGGRVAGAADDQPGQDDRDRRVAEQRESGTAEVEREGESRRAHASRLQG